METTKSERELMLTLLIGKETETYKAIKKVELDKRLGAYARHIKLETYAQVLKDIKALKAKLQEGL